MSLESNLTKLEVYINQQGFTWQQVRDATTAQWLNHAEAAGFTVEELKSFKSMKITLRKMVIQRKKQAIFDAQVAEFLVHIRKAGTDEEIKPLMKAILADWEDE